jgi:hypothetical protein
LIAERKEIILAGVRQNPDYTVYRRQPEFEHYVNTLAYKQAREIIFVDQVAYRENLVVNHDDVKGYLILTQRARMKEFLHFGLPKTQNDGLERPISTQQLKRFCLKEKTINHIIYHLTKK